MNIKKIFKRFALAMGILGPMAFVVIHYVLAHSEACDFAKNYLSNSQKVKDAIGEVQSSHLSFFHDNAVEHRNGVGVARFEISLEGQKASAEAYVTLQQIDGVWSLQSGNLILGNGNAVPLSK